MCWFEWRIGHAEYIRARAIGERYLPILFVLQAKFATLGKERISPKNSRDSSHEISLPQAYHTW